jgi:hypothetical protein
LPGECGVWRPLRKRELDFGGCEKGWAPINHGVIIYRSLRYMYLF